MKARNIIDAINCCLLWVFCMYRHKYLRCWSVYLNYLINECEVVDEDTFNIVFEHNGKKVCVWKGCKFYSFGNQNKNHHQGIYECRPSWLVMIKLSNLISDRERERQRICIEKYKSEINAKATGTKG